MSGNYEDYEFLAAHHVPAVGDVQSFEDSGAWIVTAIETYLPDCDSDLSGFYHLICTKDGKPRERERGSDHTVLGLKMDGLSIVWREPGFADWWYGSELSIPKPSPTREVLTFSPKDSKPSFDTVVICRAIRTLQVA